MNKIIFITSILVALLSLHLLSGMAEAARVRGYYKPRTGSYVQPHYRTNPNRSVFDNWSTKGNLNPYTGKWGTRDPFRPSYRYRW